MDGKETMQIYYCCVHFLVKSNDLKREAIFIYISVTVEYSSG